MAHRFEASSRGPRAFIALGLWWGLIVWGLSGINLNPWIALVLALISVPALWELLRGTTYWLELTDDTFSWGNGKAVHKVPFARIETVRFDTRLDLSVRVTLRLTGGDRIRLPDSAVPKAKVLKTWLDEVGITHSHHHFALMS